jgi:Raf kinase inhibitor-like YbhB/YbcL family protein
LGRGEDEADVREQAARASKGIQREEQWTKRRARRRGYNVKNNGQSGAPHLARTCVCVCAFLLGALGAASAIGDGHSGDQFRVSSSTFSDNAVLPISMIDNISNGTSNSCAVGGIAGGDQSPEVSWAHAPLGTQSFAVLFYDLTASFTHWGMYNIPASTNSLPAGAGIVGSTYGAEVYNDFFVDEGYDGPCPPVGVSPDRHDYVLTVYALDEDLQLQTSANFPPVGETLLHALLRATEDGHVLARSSIHGFYSATPP